MTRNQIRKSSGEKPKVSMPRHPQPLVRQRLSEPANLESVKATEIPNVREDMALRADMSVQGDLSADCSNKHVATNQSTTSSISHSSDETASVQENSDNTNLITEEIAAQLYQHSSAGPTVSGGFCDRLSVTFGGDELDTKVFWTTVDDLKVKDQKHPRLRQGKPKKSSYRSNFRIVSSEGQKLAVLQLHPKRHAMRFARLDFNPAAVGEHGVHQVRQILQMLFGDDFRELLGKGRITGLDSTVDVYGLNVDDVLTYTVQPRLTALWMRSFPKEGGEAWRLGSLYAGAKDSASRACMYDKAVQLFECKGILVKGPQSRIESRYKPAKGSKPASAADVLGSANPFAQIKMAYYPSPAPADPWFEFFLHGAREMGVNAALQRISDKNKRAAFRRALADSSPDWWQPDRYWSDALAHIQSLDLFPSELFKTKLQQLQPDD